MIGNVHVWCVHDKKTTHFLWLSFDDDDDRGNFFSKLEIMWLRVSNAMHYLVVLKLPFVFIFALVVGYTIQSDECKL